MPTPGLPTDITFSCLSTKPSVARSSISALGTLGWKDQPESWSVFAQGKPAFPVWLPMMRSRLSLASSEAIPGSASGNDLRPSATMDMHSAALAAVGPGPSSSRLPMMRA